MSYKRMLLRPAVQNLVIECNLACLHEILLETVSYHFSSLASHQLTHGLICQHPFHRIIERIRIPVSRHTPQRDGKAHTDKEILNSWFDWIVSNTDFDQAIIETSNGKDFWIHVSCRRNKRKNRHQVIRFLQKK